MYQISSYTLCACTSTIGVSGICEVVWPEMGVAKQKVSEAKEKVSEAKEKVGESGCGQRVSGCYEEVVWPWSEWPDRWIRLCLLVALNYVHIMKIVLSLFLLQALLL